MSKIILTDKNNNVDVISVSSGSAAEYFIMFSESRQYKSVVLADDDVNVKPTKKKMCISISLSVANALENYCNEHFLKKSNVIENAIIEYVNKNSD